jgi:hypothetical protein
MSEDTQRQFAVLAGNVAQSIMAMAAFWQSHHDELPDQHGVEGYPFDGSCDEVALRALDWAESVRVPATPQRFVLDEAQARAWLTEQQVNDEDFDVDIPANWEPRLLDSEDNSVYDLLWQAGERHIVTGPAPLEYVFADDSDGGMYWFTVSLKDGPRLASMYQEARKIGAPDVTGIDAAIAVLQEAVSLGNEVLITLEKYVANHS